MYSLRLFDTFILSTELMQLLIRKLEDIFFFENRKNSFQFVISIASKAKGAGLIQLSVLPQALIVTSKC